MPLGHENGRRDNTGQFASYMPTPLDVEERGMLSARAYLPSFGSQNLLI